MSKTRRERTRSLGLVGFASALVGATAALVACSGASDDPTIAGGGDGDALVVPEGGSAGDGGGGGGDDAGPTGDDAGGDSGKATDGGPGGPSKCGGSAFRVCDGFESGSVDPAIWGTTLKSNATVTVDAMHVARGSKALHVHTGVSGSDTAGTNGGIRTTHGFPFPGDQIWGRAFVYMAGQSPDMHTNMIEAVGALTDGGAASHYRIGVSTSHDISGNYIPGDYGDHSSTVMPLDAWKCFEWHFDGQNSEYHVYVDGNELTDMAITSGHAPAWTAPSFAYIEIGLHLYHDLTSIPTLDVWYDEVALDTSRVGCAK